MLKKQDPKNTTTGGGESSLERRREKVCHSSFLGQTTFLYIKFKVNTKVNRVACTLSE